MGFISWGCGTPFKRARRECNGLESPAKEGDSPVREASSSPGSIPSRAGHVKPSPNLWSPFHKAKYQLSTDSEPVP